MNPKSSLAPDSSSIGGRVRSKKQRIEIVSSESMDSSDSSLDLTAGLEDLNLAEMEGASYVAGGNRFSSVGPLSSIGVEEIAIWREKYNLSEDVIIRVPGPVDRVLDFEIDEIPVYKGFFESGFRDRVPSLVAKVSETFGISPGQLNPSAWRTLIALQNLGDLEGLSIGVAEVLNCYSVSPLNGGEGRYYLHPRSRVPLIHEIPKKERKHHPVFEGCWTEKFAFMHLLRFSPVWRAADTLQLDLSSGKVAIKRILELSSERRVWHASGEMSGSKGDEALAEYQKALGVISAKKVASKRAASDDHGDDLQFIRSNKRQTTATTAPSSSKRKSKASESTLKASPTPSCDMAAVLANLNTKVVLSTPALLASMEDSSIAIQSLQGDLLRVMSQLHHLGNNMEGQSKADLDALTSQLREEKNNALAREKEIKALRLKSREEEVVELKLAEEIFGAEKTMVVSGAKVVARWELMREWLNHQTDSWDPAVALEQYKTVKTTEAGLLGLPAPSFDDEPEIPGPTEAEKTPEPTDDDPPAE
ncbi:hypothetical protein HID58_042651 [Brassica napus]|uniref:Uncharacterized protein n=1 Tax=Brassica napus TaxID=3708 RepID=A0ABQ8BEH9_BRANA|nr:hypothetical protein HID58_042651 [Brassica napus]